MLSIVRDSSSNTHSLQSCEECRRRKRKCSKTKPTCMNCIKNKTECVYKSPRKRGPPKGYMSGLRSTSFLIDQEHPEKKKKQTHNCLSERLEFEPKIPLRSLQFLSKSSILLPKIPPKLQIELIQTFLKSFSFSAPIFHHEYFFYRLHKQALPNFLLQTMFAIGGRFFLKTHELGITDSRIPEEWLDLVRNANFTETSMQLAQQQIFMEPNTYNAIALTLLSTMMYYDGENSIASTCLMMAAK
ncbi:hypothetical protein K7432_011137 [Basidiobolus ranarum]|uniref:Zn(2)-C6 fungal-type domain-containing protein n=1 Tax=Basidiobolus ranarum TaxID=34480 RepID=A0ABR2VUC6_9FUNG